VLFIEAAASDSMVLDANSLKDEVLRRTAAFNAQLFVHERIADTEHIVVVPAGTLPRTKVASDLPENDVI
jgi:hypothetical protein